MKKYEMIFQDLKQKIEKEHYRPGDYLPSESTLCQYYQTSRDTIRKALQLLTREGMIHKRHGRGSQITLKSQFDFPVSRLTSYQELVTKLGMNSQTNLISLEKLIIDSKLSKLTGFKSNELVWRITRQRIVDGIASVIDIDYLLKSLVPNLTKEIAETSIYQYLEGTLQLPISYAQKDITIESITTQDQLLMNLGNDQHVVSIKSKVYLDDHRQLQFTESRHKLDKFRFVDFAKRH